LRINQIGGFMRKIGSIRLKVFPLSDGIPPEAGSVERKNFSFDVGRSMFDVQDG